MFINKIQPINPKPISKTVDEVQEMIKEVEKALDQFQPNKPESGNPFPIQDIYERITQPDFQDLIETIRKARPEINTDLWLDLVERVDQEEAPEQNENVQEEADNVVEDVENIQDDVDNVQEEVEDIQDDVDNVQQEAATMQKMLLMLQLIPPRQKSISSATCWMP